VLTVTYEDLRTALDPDIRLAVMVLMQHGVETYESCQGGPGHAYPEPTIAFHGGHAEGFRALAIAMTMGLPVSELRRVWRIEDCAPVGPGWQLTFTRSMPDEPPRAA
jgi:hypothetical protein